MKKFNKINIVNICLWIYFFMKPFYFASSGNIQVGDVFIILAFLLTFISNRKNKIITKDTIYILIFVVFVCLINLIYFLLYKNIDFLYNTSYYIFLLMGVIVLYQKIEDRDFLKICYYIFLMDIILQILFYITGIGKYWGSTRRYMGTLKDPNQFAFFIFICMMLMDTLENILRKKRKIFGYILGGFLIFISGSTGMLLATIVFLGLKIISNTGLLKKIKNKIINKKTIFVVLMISIVFLIILVVVGFNEKLRIKLEYFMEEYIINSSIIQRAQEKFLKSGKTDALAEDRNLDMLFNNWEKIFYGAGEGDYARFNSGGEIHSTLPSILFYYGIGPTLILLYWVYQNLKDLKFKELIPYIAIFIESFTLLNQRQLFLWFMITIAINLKKDNISNSKEKKEIEEKKKNEEIFYSSSGI